MDDRDWMLRRFEEERPRLRAVAYRMLGSASDADDALQDAWLRLEGADAAVVQEPSAWLTTVVARVCLNMLRSRQARREDSFDASTIDRVAVEDSGPEDEALLADSVGLALLVVLDTLTPAERLAFVLHDMFDLSFDEIASILGRSSAATRQLASRARRRVKGVEPAPHADVARPRIRQPCERAESSGVMRVDRRGHDRGTLRAGVAHRDGRRRVWGDGSSSVDDPMVGVRVSVASRPGASRGSVPPRGA